MRQVIIRVENADSVVRSGGTEITQVIVAEHRQSVEKIAFLGVPSEEGFALLAGEESPPLKAQRIGEHIGDWNRKCVDVVAPTVAQKTCLTIGKNILHLKRKEQGALGEKKRTPAGFNFWRPLTTKAPEKLKSAGGLRQLAPFLWKLFFSSRVVA